MCEDSLTKTMQMRSPNNGKYQTQIRWLEKNLK